MKRSLSSSDSLIPICPSAPPAGGDEKGVYRAFQPVYDGMDEDELGDEDMCSSGHPVVGSGGGGEKKRRLSADQVRALEKNFEVENKLDPERKVRLAQELALQPRQVAVWFQNRRARWKTKQLERDYTALKSSYDALRQDFDALRHNNHSLLAEIKQLKAKLGEEESYSSVKEEQEVPVASESDVKAASEAEEEPPALIYKDGSSDSDSSAVLNDDTNSPAILSASSGFVTATNVDNNSGYTPFSSSSLWASDGTRALKAAGGGGLAIGFSFQHQLLKAEEHGYDEPCSSSFFSDEQPPSLSWYYSDQWSWMDGAGGGDHSNIGKREGPI